MNYDLIKLFYGWNVLQPADELMNSIQQAEKARELRLDAKKAHDRVIASKQVKVACRLPSTSYKRCSRTCY